MVKPVLVLVAHGSDKRPHAADFLHDLAARVAALGLTDAVVPLFMRGHPSVTGFPERVAKLDPTADVVVVPVFMGRGYYTDRLVPQALGLDQPHPVRVHYAEPLGCHPDMPELIATEARQAAKGAGLAAPKTALLLVAHGSKRPGGSGQTVELLAQDIAQAGAFARVEVGFLEQEPKAINWPARFGQDDLVVMPLVLAQGLHGSRDIPAIFGFGPEGGVRDLGDHRKIVLTQGVGAKADLARMVWELACWALELRDFE